MSIAQFSHAALYRPGGTINGAVSAKRVSADFVVNGKSLLSLLVENHGGHADFMGCFARGFPDANAQALKELLLETSDGSPNQRVGIYICPECGDIGCGRYSVMVERSNGTMVWSEFAYENGYEDPQILVGIGPFQFEFSQYESVIRDCARV